MKYDISHKTLYRYEQPVLQSHQCLHLSPRLMPHQTVLKHALLIEPAPTVRHDSVDAFGNPVVLLEIDHQHDVFVVHATSTIAVSTPAPIAPSSSLPWEKVVDTVRNGAPPIDLSVLQFTCASRLTPPSRAVAEFVAPSFPKSRPMVEAVLDLTRRIFTEFRFDATATDISTPIDEVLRLRRGVCQDFSHLALACLRALKLPARYVSGYLLTRPPPGQEKLRGADASHAWISVWVPELGWIDFDPTNNLIPKDQHIVLGWGRDFSDVTPLRGVFFSHGQHKLQVEVDVIRI